jgi:3-methylcrotonyl-CoA carboxylase alpha subunit
VKVVPLGNDEYLVTEDDGRQHRVFSVTQGSTRWVFHEGDVWELHTGAPLRPRRRGAAHHESLAAPMPATVLKIQVAQGDTVTRGQTVILLEAMKMELPLRASHEGTVTAVHCREGEIVQPGAALIEIE